MKRSLASKLVLVGVVAVSLSAMIFGTSVLSDPPCTVDGPCAKGCENDYRACAAGCVLPDGRIDIDCISDCVSSLRACLDGCTTCP